MTPSTQTTRLRDAIAEICEDWFLGPEQKADKILASLSATPVSGWPNTNGKYPKALVLARYRANGMGEPDDEGSYIAFKMYIEGMDESFNFGISDGAAEHLRDTMQVYLRPQPPAQDGE